MNAAEELTDDQARQFQLDLEICYTDFNRILSSNPWNEQEPWTEKIFLWFASNTKTEMLNKWERKYFN